MSEVMVGNRVRPRVGRTHMTGTAIASGIGCLHPGSCEPDGGSGICIRRTRLIQVRWDRSGMRRWKKASELVVSPLRRAHD